MMIELTSDQFKIVEPLFRSTHYGVLAYGTLEGGHPGRVFVDDPRQPATGLVATRVGYHFLSGRPENHSSLRSLFLEDLAPKQKARLGDPQILLFYDSPDWKEILFDLFADRHPFAIHKKRMTLSLASTDSRYGWLNRIPNGFQLHPITPALLKAHPHLAGEVLLFWDSFEAFFRKSLGFCLMDGENITSVCQAVFVGAGEAEISISTAEAYRRKGCAFVTASAMIEACLKRKLNPVWGCWPENLPSIALAQCLGFTDDFDQDIYFWEE